MRENDLAALVNAKANSAVEDAFVALWTQAGDLPPDPTVSNATVKWACESLKYLLENGSTSDSAEVKALMAVIVEETRWLKEALDEKERRRRYRAAATFRYEIDGPEPQQMHPAVYKALGRAGLMYDRKVSRWWGWHSPQLEQTARELLSQQTQLL